MKKEIDSNASAVVSQEKHAPATVPSRVAEKSHTTFNAVLLRLISLCVLPLLLLAIYLAINRVMEIRTLSHQQATLLVRNFATALDQNIAARISGLQVMAASPLADEPIQLAALYRQAQGFRSSFGGEIVLADRSTQMLLNTRMDFGVALPKLPQPRGYAAAPIALASGKPTVGDTFPALVTKEPLVAVVVPVIRTGETRFLLLNIIETARLQQRLDELVLPEEWVLTVFDSTNGVLARRAPSAMATRVDANDADDAWERFVIKSAVSPWSVVLEIPRAVYLQPIIIAASTVLLLILVTTLISVIGGRRVGRQLARSVATLTAQPSSHASADPVIKEIAIIGQALEDAHISRLAAQADLRASEARYRELFESNPQPMWTYDLETLAFLEVNDAAVAHYGFSRAEFLAMTIKDIRPPEDIPDLLDELTHVGAELRGAQLWRHRRKDGSSILVDITAHSLTFGERPARLILANDVTAQKLAEEKLRLKEEKLSITLQSIGDAVIATDAAGLITRMNPTAERLTGWSLADAIDRPLAEVFKIVNTLTRKPLTNPAQLVMERGEVVGLANHTSLLARDGNEYQIFDSAAPIRNAKNTIVGVVLVFSDVTEAYNARQSIASTASLLERIGEMAKVGAWELDLRTMQPYWSLETCRIHEVDPPVAPALELAINFYAPEAQSTIIAAVDAAIKNGTPWDLELPMITAKGRPIWVRTQCSVVREGGRPTKLLGAFHDITARKQAESALRESEAFNLAILDSVRAEIAVLDRDGVILRVNQPWRRFASENGIEPGVMAPRTGIGTNYLTICDTSISFGSIEASTARAGIEAVLSGASPSFSLEYPCHSNERQRWFNLSVTPLGPDVRGAVVAHTDITERKQAELARAAIIDASLDAIISIDRSERIVVFNAAAEKLFQISAGAAIGETIERFIPVRFRSAHHAHLHRFGQSGDTVRTMGQFTRLSALRTDGLEIPIEASISHIVTGESHLFTVTMRDITEREQAESARVSLEAQLRESQKMQAIGTLAGGIAHDFNNILATILGNTELARQDVSANPRALESLDEIRKAGARARDLVQQILSFSRRQPTLRKPIALAPIIEESARLLRATLPARLTLNVYADIHVPMVLADATQIEQVVINLCTNAMQAIHSGAGRIVIRLDTVMLDNTTPDSNSALQTLREKFSGLAVRLTVSDDGAGMDAATLERIFEPFFTTKPVDEGTGLGLSVVHGIVQAHHGVITVDSLPGKGTIFTLYFPTAAPDVAENTTATLTEAPTTTASAEPPANVHQHILYLDDDEALVFLVQRLIERRGYQVSGFSDQREALDAVRADPNRFDLVVTDYNMPGMSGLDVARVIRAIRADLPVAVASGFIDEALRAQAEGAGVRELIFKANAAEELCEAFIRLAQSTGEKHGGEHGG